MKRNKLKEWLGVLSQKEWKQVHELCDTSLYYLPPLSMKALKKLCDNHRHLINWLEDDESPKVFDENSFGTLIKMRIKKTDWSYINSEISMACSFYKKCMLSADNHIPTELSLQSYFMENKMEKNLDSIIRTNSVLVYENKIRDNYSNVWKARMKEMEIEYIDNKDIRKKLPDLKIMQEAIELYYHENKLRVLCERINRNSFEKDAGLTDEEWNWNKRIPETFLDFPQIRIYSTIFEMLKDSSEDNFLKLEELATSSDIYEQVAPHFLSDVFGYLIVFCRKKINNGDLDYAHKYKSFIDTMKDTGILLEQGKIPIWRLKNVIKVAAKINEWQWASDFIEEQKINIDPKHRLGIVNYCHALLAYEQGYFDKAYEELDFRYLSKDIYIKVDTLILELFLLLRRKDIRFQNQKDNLRGLVNTKKDVADNYIKKWRKTINNIGYVYKTVEIEKYKELKIKIQNDGFFPGKKWLLDYLDELIEKNKKVPEQ